MIRLLQVGVNNRTERYTKQITGEQAESPDVIEAVRRLGDAKNGFTRSPTTWKWGRTDERQSPESPEMDAPGRLRRLSLRFPLSAFRFRTDARHLAGPQAGPGQEGGLRLARRPQGRRHGPGQGRRAVGRPARPFGRGAFGPRRRDLRPGR